jgi:dihydrofolate synthase/folylpolyglutamate synthase
LALAMRWFRESGCDLIVLETGMGGRLDATTAVPADVCVITPIGMDHMQWLGDTLEKIAAEKAGILVTGKPAISSPQEPGARFVLEKEANEVRAPLEFIAEPLLGYPIALAGSFQRWNAALAVAALHRAGLPLREENVRHGLASLDWPGRFEEIRPGVVLDGAHNPHAAAILARTWNDMFPETKCALVFSAVADKEISAILEILAPLAEKIFLCPVNTPRAVSPDALAACLPADAPPHEVHGTLESALAAARSCGTPVLVAGSLFLIGEARALLTGAEFQPCTQ